MENKSPVTKLSSPRR